MNKLEKLEKLITQKLIKIHSVDGKVVWKGPSVKGYFLDGSTTEEINHEFEECIKNTAKVLFEINSYTLVGTPTPITLHSSANYCYCDLEDYNDNCEDSLDEFLRSQVRYYPGGLISRDGTLGKLTPKTSGRLHVANEPFYLLVLP